jgi:hypothetical protein
MERKLPAKSRLLRSAAWISFLFRCASFKGNARAAHGRLLSMLPAALLTVTTMGMTGCAGVEAQRGKDLASAGVQYTRATTALVDVAIDANIDADSEVLVRTKLPPAALSLPENAPDKLKGELEKKNKGLIENTRLFYSLRASLSTVEGYFLALQSLAENPQSEATASAIATLSDRVNTLNGALKKADGPVKPVINDAQKTALTGLTKLVADQIHGAIVAAALKRDAPIIGEALLLQERVLDLSGAIISGALSARANIFFVDNVQRPFEKQELGSAWVLDRNRYIKAAAVGEMSRELQTARAASAQMGKTWEKILSGVYDASEMRRQLTEMEALVSALSALKQAEKPKTPTQ